MNIHNAFHQGQYSSVVEFDTSAFSETNALPSRILKLRARIQLGQIEEVISEVKNEAASNTDIQAVLILARHIQKPSDQSIIENAATLAAKNGENLSVELLCGTVLANAGRKDEALALLAKHQGSLDACVVETSRCRDYRLMSFATGLHSSSRFNSPRIG